MLPKSARFVPNGTESFSHAFVRNVGPFEANDIHVYRAQMALAERAARDDGRGLNLLSQRGT